MAKKKKKKSDVYNKASKAVGKALSPSGTKKIVVKKSAPSRKKVAKEIKASARDTKRKALKKKQAESLRKSSNLVRKATGAPQRKKK